MYRDPLPEPASAPKACPFCTSADVRTTSKHINDATYWRCAACGQIWNAARLQVQPARRWFR